MIKNIIFDIGNVILKWQPETVVGRLFPDQDILQLTRLLFRSPLWCDLNMGKMTEAELIETYHKTLDIRVEVLIRLMREIKESLLPVENSLELLKNLHRSQYSLYALTDNVREIVTFLRAKYDFWDLFQGVVVSAEVGYLKPMKQIYQTLIDLYDIDPAESVFIDDILRNVEGAQSVGMQGIHFLSANQCAAELKNKYSVIPATKVKLNDVG